MQTWKVNESRVVELVCQLVLILSSGFRGAAGLLGAASRNQVAQPVRNSTITSAVNRRVLAAELTSTRLSVWSLSWRKQTHLLSFTDVAPVFMFHND